MKIYGLTGGIASGKSTVAAILKELHVNVIDADMLARAAVEPGSIGLHKIVERFGEKVLLENRSLDRKRLGNMVFGNKESIKALNDIVHPEVDRLYQELVEKYKLQGCDRIIYDCPLMIEENLTDRVDEVILVITAGNLQLERLMSRNGFTKEEAILRINSQIKMEEKISHAHYVIYNDGNYDQLKTAVIHLWNQLTTDFR